MAVLQLEPTKAPDFTGTSRILAQAGLSMDRAFESAQGILSSYQEGAQDKVDNEVFAETAGMNREQLQAFFDKNGLKGRNLSQSARERLAGQFGTIADVNRTRGLTGALADQTLRANASEARTVIGFDRSERIRQADIDRKGLFDDARRERLGLPSAAPAVEGVPGPRTAAVEQAPAGAAIEAAATAPGGGGAPAAVAYTPRAGVNETESGFMSQVSAGYTAKDGTAVPGVKNPYALAVIAATGQHESAFDPKNVSRQWEDGKNNAGGTMSWNGKRLKAMQDFVGDDKSSAAQARFLLQENPELMRKLEATTSIEEANDLMAKAWRFKGYKNTGPGTEYAGRLETARKIYGNGPDAAVAVSGGPVTSTPLDPIAVAAAPKPPVWATGALRGSTEEQADEAARRIQAEIDVTDPVTGFNGSAPTAVADPIAVAAGGNADAGAAGPTAAPTPPAAPVGTPAMDAFRESVLNDPDIGSKEAAALFADMKAYEDQGIAERKSKKAEKARDTIAGMVIKNAQAADIQTTRKLVLQTIEDAQAAGMSNEEVIQSAEFAALLGNGALKDVVIPKVTDNTMLDAVIAVSVKADDAVLNAYPQTRMFAQATIYSKASTVTQGLIDSLGIHKDDETTSSRLFGAIGEVGTDDKILTDYINMIARKGKVTPAVAAAAMFEHFIRDPFWTNTVDSRFPEEEILTFLSNNMDAKSVARFQSAVLKNQARRQEFSKERLVLDELQGRYNKMKAGKERDQIGEQIASIKNTLMTGSTSEEGRLGLKRYIGPAGLDVADQLSETLGTNPELHQFGLDFVATKIRKDKNLSPTEKTLYLSTLGR